MLAIQGEKDTGFEARGADGPFECGNCVYFDAKGACGQKDMMEKSKRPRHPDGTVVVAYADCCEYIKRPKGLRSASVWDRMLAIIKDLR